MRMRRSGIALATLALFGMIASGCTDGSDDKSPQPAPATSAAQQHPGFLNEDGIRRSRPLTDLKVGETGFIVLGLESFPYLGRKANGTYCLAANTPWWTNPGRKVGDIVAPHAGVTRTDVGTYTLITKPDTQSEKLAEYINSLAGTCEMPVTKVDTSLAARKVLGFPEDFIEGQVGYVPGDTIWVASPTSREGRLLSATISASGYPGAVGIKKVGKNFQLLAGPANLHVVSSEQMAVRGMNELPRVLLPAS